MRPKISKRQARSAWKLKIQQGWTFPESASKSICQILSKNPVLLSADFVGIFCPRRWEPNLAPLWQSFPEKCVFPKVEGNSLTFYKVEAWADLQPGFKGILEPGVACQRVSFPTSRSVVLVPGACFDFHGGRVGSGLGFYDRFLERKPGERWGVCSQEQTIQDSLEQDATDVRMTGLCTEQGLQGFA